MILVTAKDHHARVVAENLRDADKQELAIVCPDQEVLETVLAQWVDSDLCEAILTDDGEVAGMWGVSRTPGIDKVGSIWMLGTASVKKVAIAFLRESPRAIGRAHFIYPCLVCTPWRENSLHLSWLEWCGFGPHDPGHGHFIAYTHVWTPSHPHRDAGDHCGLSGDAVQPAEQGDLGTS